MFANSNHAPSDLGGPQVVKLLIADGFGAGKTTLVAAVSEVKPLRTEERLPELGAAVDDLTGVAGKTTTTVALDFGRITISPEMVLYLIDTPGQDQFWFMWKDLSADAVVLADTRRLGDCFGAVDFFEPRDIPFIVAVNCFDGADIYRKTRCARHSTSARTSRCVSVTPAAGSQASRCLSTCSSTCWRPQAPPTVR